MPDIATQTEQMFKHLEWVEAFSIKPSDISDHLKDLYKATVSRRPRLIVELGVRDADSSHVLGKAAEECDALLIGVDILQCNYHDISNAIFCKMNDVVFARRFREFCPMTIDVLFIDTSHLYEHTVQEIEGFFPLLSDEALVAFHDTNMATQYQRRDGSQGAAWDNERGVIKAIEEYFDTKMDETREFERELIKDDCVWRVRQNPLCNGFMLCWKMTSSDRKST